MVGTSKAPGAQGTESGHALILALVVVLLVATSMTLLSKALLMELNQVRARADQLELVALADACLSESLAELAQRPGFGGLSRRPLGRGSLESRISTEGAPRPDGRRVRILVESRVGERVYRVAVRVRLRQDRAPTILDWQRRP